MAEGDNNPVEPAKEVVHTEPVETTTHEATPPVEHASHVSRAEFDGLKSAIDGLTATVAQIVPQTPEQDAAPGGVPWTHKFGRTS